MRNRYWICLLLVFSAMNVTGALSQSLVQYTITGEIRNSAGSLMPGAFICYRMESPRRDGGWLCAAADRDGVFAIRPYQEGRYILRPQNVPIRPDPKMHMPTDQYAAFTGVEVTLNSDNPDAHVDLQLPQRNGMLFVTAVDSLSNSPIELATVHVCPAEAMLRCGGLPLRSDSGEFRIYTPPYPFNISISSPGYREWVFFGDHESVIDPGVSSHLHIQMQPLSQASGGAPGNSMGPFSRLLPAPVQLAPAAGAKFADYPRTTTLKWAEVVGAVSYSVEVDYCRTSQNLNECLNPAPLIFPTPQGKAPWPSTIEDTTFTFDFVGAQPGRWRVWAIDKQGRRGTKSPWRIFFYAR